MIELQPVRRENSAEINDLKLKIIMIGGPRVGKSCILNKMVYNKFYLGLGPTIGVECGSIRVAHENRFFRIQVWDVEGHGGSNPIPEEFYKNAIGAFLIVDLTRKESLQEAKKALTAMQDKSNSALCTMLLGTKKDLSNLREISVRELEDITEAYSLKYMEVSAFSGEGLKESLNSLMDEITKLILRAHDSIPFMSEFMTNRSGKFKK